ncbi:MAG: tetratricopeptide repeat protein [Elusimicrobiota bacterium]|nr:MAG: tetratricopeptide repeat protein [Elusimicrobiota bacterium]
MRGAVAAALALSLCGCGTLPKVFRHADPLSAEEHARLGAAYEAEGLGAEAEKQYVRALVLDKRHQGAWMALGNRAYEAGDYEKAERCYRRVLRIAPRHAGAANNLAMAYLARGKRLAQARKLALEALPEAGALRPHVLDTLARLDAAERLRK